MTVQGIERALDSPRSLSREWADAIAGFPIFDDLSRRDLRKLAAEARFAEFAPGDEVIGFGTLADSLFVIVSGQARARGRRAARSLRRGDFFGEMALIGQRRSATVIATSELHVMELPQRTLNRLVKKHPSVGLRILEEVGLRLQRLEQLVGSALP